jgi:hypothetical protein
MNAGDQRIRDAATLDPIVGQDTPCKGCGYNLKGLIASGKCPECGRPIRRRRRINHADCTITSAPKTWLSLYALGATLTFLGWPIMIMCAIFRCVSGSRGLAVAALVTGCVWWLGVVITTRPRPKMPDMDHSPAREWFWQRTFARLLTAAIAVPLGVLLATAEGAAPVRGLPTTQLWLLADLGLIVSALGFIAYAFYQYQLAHWAGDAQASTKWRAAGVAVLAASFFVVLGRNISITDGLSGALTAIPGTILFLVLFLSFVGAPILFALWALMQQRETASWAVANHELAIDKVERDRAKLEQERAAFAAAGPPDIVPHVNMPAVAESKKSRYNPRTMVPGPAPKRIKFTDPDLGGSPDIDKPYGVDPEGTPAPEPAPGKVARTRHNPGLLYNPKTMTPGPAPKRITKFDDDDLDQPAFDLSPAPDADPPR